MEFAYEKYAETKYNFLRSIGAWEVETSPMDQYGRYHKEYVGERGTWYEVMSPIEEMVELEAEVHGAKVKIRQNVKFLCTEFWNSKDPASNYCCERW